MLCSKYLGGIGNWQRLRVAKQILYTACIRQMIVKGAAALLTDEIYLRHLLSRFRTSDGQPDPIN